MFKKNLWIVALLAALAMVFIGCPGGGGVEEEEESYVIPVDTKFIQISGRYGNWHSIDIRGGLGFSADIGSTDPAKENYTADKSHTIYVFGRALGATNVYFAGAQTESDAPGGGGQAAFADPGTTQSYDPNGEFEITREFTWAEISKNNDIRVVGISDTIKIASFYEIKITDEDGTVVYQLSVDPEVQGKDHNYEIFTETVGGIAGRTTKWLKGALGGNAGVAVAKVQDPAELKPCCTDCDPSCEDCANGDCTDACGEDCCIPEEPIVQEESFNVKVGTGEGDVITVQATSIVKNNGIGAICITGGIEISNIGYGSNKFVSFPIDLGTKTIADFASVKFTYTGVEGDFNYKNPQPVAVKKDATISPASELTRAGSTGSISAGTASSQDLKIFGSLVTARGLTGESEIELGFVVTADATAVIRITNIELVPGTNAADDTITIDTIGGISAPVAGAVPTAAITPTAQFTGTVAWEPVPSGEGGKFQDGYTGKAVITLTPIITYTLTGLTADFFTVTGAENDGKATNDANAGVVSTANYPVAEAPPAEITLTFTDDNDELVAALGSDDVLDTSDGLLKITAANQCWGIKLSEISTDWAKFAYLVFEVEYSDVTGSAQTNWKNTGSFSSGGAAVTPDSEGNYGNIAAGTKSYTFAISKLTDGGVGCQTWPNAAAYTVKVTSISLLNALPETP